MHAHSLFRVAIPALIASLAQASAVRFADPPLPTQRRSGKARSTSAGASGAAAIKRAARTRRNIRRNASKRRGAK